MSSKIGKWLPVHVVLEMSEEDDQEWLSVMRYKDRARYHIRQPTIATDGHGLHCFVDLHSAKMFMMTLYKDIDQLHLWKGRGLFTLDPHDQVRKVSHWNGVVADVIEIEECVGRWDEVYHQMKPFLTSVSRIPRAVAGVAA